MRFLGKRPGMNLNLGYLLMSRKLFTNYFSKEFLHSLIIISGAQFHMWVFIQSVDEKPGTERDWCLIGFWRFTTLTSFYIYAFRIVWQRIEVRAVSAHFLCPKQQYSIEYLKKVKHLVVIGWDTHARTKSLSEKKGAKKLNLRPFVHQRATIWRKNEL